MNKAILSTEYKGRAAMPSRASRAAQQHYADAEYLNALQRQQEAEQQAFKTAVLGLLVAVTEIRKLYGVNK